MRILIIEDYPLLGQFLQKGLDQEGHVTVWSKTIEDALEQFWSNNFDAVIADRRLPDGDGLDFVKVIREEKAGTIIIMLTSMNEPESRLEGLQAGADDYIGKPFSFGELVFRLNRLVYKHASTHGIKIGKLRIDPSGHRAWINDSPVNLTAKEFSILLVLASKTGRVVEGTQLLAQVWGEHEQDSLDKVHVFINRLRKKIGKEMITTVRGLGYILDSPTEVEG
jgi:DNA-binding response OmpR family regulator